MRVGVLPIHHPRVRLSIATSARAAHQLPIAAFLPSDFMSSENENSPFEVQVAQRVTRLPPYLFGRINKMIYDKRVAGDDVIELGMGNPSDPPEDVVIEKLNEAARDSRNHRYSKSNGIANLRREVGAKYVKKYGVRLDPDSEIITCLGSKEGFSHMCLALMGPGDTAIVPAPYFPVHVYAVALASGNVIRSTSATAASSCPMSPTRAKRSTPSQSC